MRCRLYNFFENNYLLGHDLQSTTDEYTYDAHGNMRYPSKKVCLDTKKFPTI